MTCPTNVGEPGGVSPRTCVNRGKIRGLTPNGTHFTNPKRERGRLTEAFPFVSLAYASGYLVKVSAIGLTPPGSPVFHLCCSALLVVQFKVGDQDRSVVALGGGQ